MYDAFISYSRKDFPAVKELHNFIQSYYVGGLRWPRKIFMDVSSLSGKQAFPLSIREALNESKYLVVCCSPNSKYSPWVDAEIEYFIQKCGDKKIIICLIGDPDLEENNLIPDRILKIEENRNSYLDAIFLIRFDFRNKGRYLRSKEYREEGLGIILGILELNRDEALRKMVPVAIFISVPLYLSIIVIAVYFIYRMVN